MGKRFIHESVAERKPFFLYLPVNPPHIPWLVPEKYRQPYLNKGLDDKSINFYSMIGTVDENLGSFIDFLQAEGVWDNTLFMFLTDNGSTLWDQEYNAGLRGQKGSVYEGGHRVPFFLHWPNGTSGPPRVIDTLLEVQDLFPSLLSWCDLSLEGDISFDGLDISGLVQGKPLSEELNNRIEVVQCYEEKYDGTIMWQNWRLVHGTELYNLDEDLAQQNNVANQNTHIVDSLRNYYETWWSQARLSLIPEPYYINGSEEIQLTAYDWYDGPRVFNWPHLRRGEKGNGKYRIVFQEAGNYTITLRHWPKESGLGIRASAPAFVPFDDFLGELPTGKALDITRAKVKIGDQLQFQEVAANTQEVVFTFDIPAAETHLQTWFIEPNGKEFGAYYVYIRKE